MEGSPLSYFSSSLGAVMLHTFAAMLVLGKALAVAGAGCMPNILQRQRSDHSSRADLSVVADSKVSYEILIFLYHICNSTFLKVVFLSDDDEYIPRFSFALFSSFLVFISFLFLKNIISLFATLSPSCPWS